MYDIIIVGGGIAGLYTTYKLLLENPSYKILVIEKNNYLGGRIKTFYKTINNHNFVFEEGAGRLNKNHILLLKLIEDFNLTKNLSKIESNTHFYPSNKTYNFKKKYIGKSPFIYIKKIIKYSKNIKKEDLIKYSFKTLALKVLSKDDVQFILDSFGYYKQLISMNSYNALKLFNLGMKQSLQFYHLEPGFNIIIEKLCSEIINMNGKIILSTEVSNIEYNTEKKYFNIITHNKNYKSKICILALPKPNLIKFTFLSDINNLLNSISYKSLCRIYAVFNKKDIWFNNIPKTTTNNNSRYIIPLDKKHGSIMISYSDSKFADYWNKLYKLNNGKKLLLYHLKKNILNTYKIKINDPIFIKVCYWKCAIGYWKINKDSKKISNSIIKPYDNINLFICGENYSETQGWIEGALETSEIVCNKIKNLINIENNLYIK